MAEVLQIETRKAHNYTYAQEAWLDIRHGDREALASLFCMYYKPLYQYGFKMSQSEELVKDCIQDLFYTIWNKRNSISEARSVKSYLLSSMRRMVLRHIQKQRNCYERNRLYLENFSEDTINIDDLMIQFDSRSDHRINLSEAVDRLTKRQKEVIYLKYYDGLTNSEIAYVMGIKIQSVYNHVSEAIRELQTHKQIYYDGKDCI